VSSSAITNKTKADVSSRGVSRSSLPTSKRLDMGWSLDVYGEIMGLFHAVFVETNATIHIHIGRSAETLCVRDLSRMCDRCGLSNIT